MLQQRRSFTSSASDRPSGRQQQQQASRLRTASFWEALFLVVLLFLTCLNLYTYTDRRERFQRARGGVVADPAAGASLRVPPSSSPRQYDTKVFGGGWRGEQRAAGVRTGSGAQGGSGADGSAAVAASSVTGTRGGGGTGAASWTKSVPPPPPLSSAPPAPPARPTPLGRDRPLQIMAAAPGASSLRWPAAADGGGGGGNGPLSPTVGHFPCSLTEGDEARSTKQQQRQKQEQTWSTSGPCVVSCSPPSSPDGGERSSSSLGRYEYCARAVRACELYQECTHVLLPPPPATGDGDVDGDGGGGGGGLGFATLMHLPAEDGSMAGVEAAAAAAARAGADGGAGWGGGSNGGWGFTLETRPRTYYVVSFGGSGSKMLGGWLSERGGGMVKKVFHIHDPRPADTLFAKVARKSVSSGRTAAGKAKDFRNYDFPEGDFPVGGTAVRDVDSYRVVLIFKDPAEALVSRYFYNHCKNIRGAECGATQADFPSLERYAEETGDRLHMETFYDNYCDPATVDGAAGSNGGRRRNYPVVCVNYHKMWDNKEALVRALGLPAAEALKLPERTETVRNDETSAARGEPFTLAMRQRLRRKHASLSEKVFGSPAVAIV